MKKRRPRVGIFDSGVGGLTVLHECAKYAPYAQYFYLSDNARAPYGNRSGEEIYAFTREAMQRFHAAGADAVVIACNTATAIAADGMRREFSFPVIGLEPALKPAAKTCKRILVLATERTVKSAKMQMLAGRFPESDVSVHACPRLAGAIENYLTKGEPVLLSAHLPSGKFDGVVLGCTHYIYFAKQISAYYSAPVFDGNEGVARRLTAVLEKRGFGQAVRAPSAQNPNERFTFIARNKVKFVGKSKKINEKVYFRTFVSLKNEINL